MRTIAFTAHNLFVLDRFPDALDEDIIAPRTLAIHADGDVVGDQNAREGFAGELAALVGVENVWRPLFRQGLLQRFNTEGRLHRDRHAMAEHAPAEPVDDGGEIDEAARHRDIGDVHRPDLVRTFDLQPAQKIGINLIPWRGLRRIRLTVDRFDPHAHHQRGDMAAADLDALAVQKVTQHPAPRERVFQMQPVSYTHL